MKTAEKHKYNIPLGPFYSDKYGFMVWKKLGDVIKRKNNRNYVYYDLMELTIY